MMLPHLISSLYSMYIFSIVLYYLIKNDGVMMCHVVVVKVNNIIVIIIYLSIRLLCYVMLCYCKVYIYVIFNMINRYIMILP